MLKISVNPESAEMVRLRAEGRLVGPWVDELQKSCEPLLQGHARVSLDADGITFTSLTGLLLLKELMKRGVEVRRCPLFLAAQLKESSHE